MQRVTEGALSLLTSREDRVRMHCFRLAMGGSPHSSLTDTIAFWGKEKKDLSACCHLPLGSPYLPVLGQLLPASPRWCRAVLPCCPQSLGPPWTPGCQHTEEFPASPIVSSPSLLPAPAFPQAQVSQLPALQLLCIANPAPTGTSFGPQHIKPSA